MTQSQPDSGETPVPRGLWSLMSKASPPSTSPEELPPAAVEEESSAPPRSLFDVMRQASGINQSDSTHTDHADIAVNEPGGPELTSFPATFELEPDSIPSFVPPQDIGNAPGSKISRSKSILTPLICGLLAAALSGLAVRPEFWMSVPASILGFAAIILGYLQLSSSDLARHSTARKGMAMAGVLTGVLGVFLGPLFFFDVGRRWRDASGDDFTRRHLTAIGQSLDRYHNQHGTFPPGGTFVPNDSGNLQGMHGWMTFLLPCLGEQSLYQSIDQSKPFDAPVNREPMGTEVLAFYAAGADRTRLGQGYAVAHFAGVGGELEGLEGTMRAGVFDRNSAVRRQDISDGLANTLAAGELAGNFSPWGDPENWRTIGRGLNKDVNGFGNAKGTGALFLFADGSVKFLVNRTDPKVLQQLSTRNGQDNE